MEASKGISDGNVSARKNLSDSDIYSKRLSFVPDDEDLRIVGFKVKLDEDQAYTFALDKTQSKSADVLTILTNSKKMFSRCTNQEHGHNSAVIRNFLQISNADEQTLPQKELEKSEMRIKEESQSVPLLQLKLGSNREENKEFEIHIKSKNDNKNPSLENEGLCSSNDRCDNEEVEVQCRNPQETYFFKSPKKSPVVPLKHVTEMASSATQTEKETKTTSMQTAHVEVREPTYTQDTASQAGATTHDVSTGTEEKDTESVGIETDVFPQKHAAAQTEKETASVSSQTEIAAMYSIDRAYDVSTQTKQVEDTGTSTDFDIYIVDRENVTDKAADTEDLPFSPLKVAKEEKVSVVDKVTSDLSCHCPCGHRDHNRCIYKCCFHKEYTNMISACLIQCPYHQFASFSSRISDCNLCHCHPRSNCNASNSCDENFRFDIHQLHCCRCKNLNVQSNFDKTEQQVPKDLKALESTRTVKVNSLASRENISNQTGIEIVKNLEHALKISEDVIAVKVFQRSKVESVSVLKIPLVFQHYMKSFDISTYKPSRVVVNPIDITSFTYKTKAFEDAKDARLKSKDKQLKDENLQATGKKKLVMFCDDGKTKAVIFRPKTLKIVEDKHPQICLCDKCFSNVHRVVQKDSEKTVKEEERQGRTSEERQRNRTSPTIKHKVFNYTSKDGWKPYDHTSEDVLSKKVEATDIIYVEESSSEECFESAKSIGLNEACETVNDHLLDLRPIDEDKVRKAAETLHKLWFEVAGTKYSDVQEVRSYIQYFQEFSNNLFKTLLHSVDNNGNNVLHFAFANNRFDLAEEFLNNGFTNELLRKTNKTGNSPLMICSISQPKNNSEWSTVRKSFEMGSTDAKSMKTGQTPLMNAASCGFQTMVDLLLDVGANPNFQDKDGSTALMYAAEHGHEKCVKSLVKHKKCDPTIRDKDGQTACSIALSNGHKNVAVLIHMQALEKRRLSKNLYCSKRYAWTNNKRNESRKKSLSLKPKPLSISSDSP